MSPETFRTKFDTAASRNFIWFGKGALEYAFRCRAVEGANDCIALPSIIIVPVTDRVWLSEWQVLLCTYVFTYLGYSFILWYLTELSVDPIM